MGKHHRRSVKKTKHKDKSGHEVETQPRKWTFLRILLTSIGIILYFLVGWSFITIYRMISRQYIVIDMDIFDIF